MPQAIPVLSATKRAFVKALKAVLDSATNGNYLRVASNNVEERTPAQVLSDIGAASASDLSTHEADTANPHSVTAAQADALPEDAAILSKSANYELAAGDEGKIIECDGTFTITCPNGLDTGFQVTIVNVGSGTITIAATTTLQATATTLATQYKGAVVYHRGTNVWLAMGGLE